MISPRFCITRGVFGMSWELRFGGSYSVGLETYLDAAEPITIKSYKQPEYPSQPMLSMNGSEGTEALQSLMDELWREGFRPKDIGTAGHLSATQKHLEDMRAIAFAKLETPKPCS